MGCIQHWNARGMTSPRWEGFMPNLTPYDPAQKPNLHNDINTFDDPIRRVGPDIAATFDNSTSNPTEWAGSEALRTATETDEDDGLSGEGFVDSGVLADAPDTGIDDADLAEAEAEDEADEEGLDVEEEEDEDIDESEDRVFTKEAVKKFH
jgi:hypothetical protein